MTLHHFVSPSLGLSVSWSLRPSSLISAHDSAAGGIERSMQTLGRHRCQMVRLAWLAALMVLSLCDVAAAKPQAAAPAAPRAPEPPRATDLIVIDNTQQAALGQPKVLVRLSNKSGPLRGTPPAEANPLLPGLDELGLGDGGARGPVEWFIAYLDTGGSGYVISKAAATRLGIAAQPEAVYNEVGLHGAARVGVSPPLTIELAGSSGAADEELKGRGVILIQKNALLQLSLDSPTGLMALGAGELNVIGMPAISRLVVEIDPGPMRAVARQQPQRPNPDPLQQLEDLLSLGQGPRVVLHERSAKPRDVDVTIALEYKDFNQRQHPDNRGPLPELASNPVIPAVECGHGAATCTGEWLLDTGAAASIISTKIAQALGLYREDGTLARTADFTLPLGGIGGSGGEVKAANGFIIDRVTINCRQGKRLEFRKAHVVVLDVGMKLPDGRELVLDGVLGMNLLLPSGSGFQTGLPRTTDEGAFERMWIDGARGTLALKLAEQKTKRRRQSKRPRDEETKRQRDRVRPDTSSLSLSVSSSPALDQSSDADFTCTSSGSRTGRRRISWSMVGRRSGGKPAASKRTGWPLRADS